MRGRWVVAGALYAMTSLGAVGAMTACTQTGQAAGEIAPENAIAVQVRNDNYLDMDVFAVASGISQRLGTVSGNGTRTFLVDPSFAATGVNIVATPIGARGRAATGVLSVGAGETIDFRIAPILSNSSVIIR